MQLFTVLNVHNIYWVVSESMYCNGSILSIPHYIVGLSAEVTSNGFQIDSSPPNITNNIEHDDAVGSVYPHSQVKYIY